MRKFNGLRPQDVALLLKLVTHPPGQAWLGKELAQALYLSASVGFPLKWASQK